MNNFKKIMHMCSIAQAVSFLQISEPVDEEIAACESHDRPSDTLTNSYSWNAEQIWNESYKEG